MPPISLDHRLYHGLLFTSTGTEPIGTACYPEVVHPLSVTTCRRTLHHDVAGDTMALCTQTTALATAGVILAVRMTEDQFSLDTS